MCAHVHALTPSCFKVTEPFLSLTLKTSVELGQLPELVCQLAEKQFDSNLLKKIEVTP